jgi:hypothetical protein
MTALAEIEITDGYYTTINLNNPIVASNTVHLAEKMQFLPIGVKFTTVIGSSTYLVLAPWSNVSGINQSTSDTSAPLSFDELDFSGSGNDVYGNFASGGPEELVGSIDVKEEGVWFQTGSSISLFPWNVLHGLYQEA